MEAAEEAATSDLEMVVAAAAVVDIAIAEIAAAVAVVVEGKDLTNKTKETGMTAADTAAVVEDATEISLATIVDPISAPSYRKTITKKS